MSISLVVIQPSSFCNIDCKYCYVPERNNKEVMDELTLGNIIRKTLESKLPSKKIMFLMHAGEPLTVNLEFYQKAVEMIGDYNKHNRSVTLAFQTNATLITEAWCKFFVKNKIAVSVSIDGPALIHDLQRQDRKGKGTFVRCMKGIELLKKHKINLFALCTLTRESLQYPLEIIRFFKENEFNGVGFNVDEILNVHSASSVFSTETDQRQLAEKEYRLFFDTLLEEWWKDKRIYRIREFDDIISRLRKKVSDPQFYPTPQVTKPQDVITIQRNGNISTNSPELSGAISKEYSNFIVGNINEISQLSEIYENEVYLKMQRDIQEGIKKCASECFYFDLCGGGRPSNKFFENGSFNSAETQECTLQEKVMISLVVSKLGGLRA